MGLTAPGVKTEHHSDRDDRQDDDDEDEDDAHAAARAFEVPLRMDVLCGAPLHCLPRHIYLRQHLTFRDGRPNNCSSPQPVVEKAANFVCVLSKEAGLSHATSRRPPNLTISAASTVSTLFYSEIMSMPNSRETQNSRYGNAHHISNCCCYGSATQKKNNTLQHAPSRQPRCASSIIWRKSGGRENSPKREDNSPVQIRTAEQSRGSLSPRCQCSC